MSEAGWPSLIQSLNNLSEKRRKQEQSDPSITENWSSAAPVVSNIAAHYGSGGAPGAGTAASAAVKIAMNKNPDLKNKIGSVTREATYTTGTSVALSVGSILAAPILIGVMIKAGYDHLTS